jgi:hypothetical protein
VDVELQLVRHATHPSDVELEALDRDTIERDADLRDGGGFEPGEPPPAAATRAGPHEETTTLCPDDLCHAR